MATANYREYVWSKYHPWFVELGYPRLDVNQYADGEWGIIEWLSYPCVPSETQWQLILSGIRNVEITKSRIEKFVHQNDMHRPEFWQREDAKSEVAEREYEEKLDHEDEFAERATAAITNNPGLCDRILKNGTKEMDPLQIARHVPSYQW